MTGEAAFNLAPWKRFLIACYLGRDRIVLVDQLRWGRMAVRNRIYTDETRLRGLLIFVLREEARFLIACDLGLSGSIWVAIAFSWLINCGGDAWRLETASIQTKPADAWRLETASIQTKPASAGSFYSRVGAISNRLLSRSRSR